MRLIALIITMFIAASCKNNIAPADNAAAPHLKLAEDTEKNETDSNEFKSFPGFPGSLNGTKGDTPLALNLYEGKTLQLAEKHQLFDIDGDESLEEIDWLHHGALLALDLNGNNKIDSGRELFGNATLSSDGVTTFNDGFSALAAYDVDQNGYIDARDPVFQHLLIWIDRNDDAMSQPDELMTCADHGIEAIALRPVPEDQKIQSSRIILKSSFTTQTRTGDIVDIVFKRYRQAASHE